MIIEKGRSIFTKKNALNIVLICAVVAAAGLVLWKGGEFATFLGSLGHVPAVGEGAKLKLERDYASTSTYGGVTPYNTIHVDDKIVANVVLVSTSQAPLMAVTAQVNFDPAFLTVEKIEMRDFSHHGDPEDPLSPIFTTVVGDPESIKTGGNSSGHLRLSFGESYPGTDKYFDGRVLAKITFKGKAVTGASGTNITLDYGSGRDTGKSQAIVVDDNNQPHDVLDQAAGGISGLVVTDVAPQILTTDLIGPKLIDTASSTPTPMVIRGKLFGKDSVVIFDPNDLNSNQLYTFTPTSVSDDGTQIILNLPPHLSFPGTETSYGFSIQVKSRGQVGIKGYGSSTIYSQKLYDSTTIGPKPGVRLQMPPTITSISPTVLSGQMSAAQTITINGSWLATGWNVSNQYLGNNAPIAIRLINDSFDYELTNIHLNPTNKVTTGQTVTATTAGKIEPGTYSLVLEQAGTTSYNAISYQSITVTDTPTITSTSPQEVTADVSTTTPLTLFGNALGTDKNQVEVTFVGPQTTAFNITSLEPATDTELAKLVGVPAASLQPGRYSMLLKIGGVSSPVLSSFTVTPPTQPQLTGINPSSFEFGYAANTKVTLSGGNLKTAQSVVFKNATQNFPSSHFDVVTDQLGTTSLSVSVPDGLPIDTYSAVVTLSNGQFSELQDALTIMPITPKIMSLDPSEVVVDYPPDTALTVTGTGFSTRPVVSFIGTQTYQATITQATDTQIIATLPVLPVGLYKVSVTSQNGQVGTWINGNQFMVRERPEPTYTSISPRIVTNKYPDLLAIRIDGENIRANSQIRFVGATTTELINESTSSDGKKITAQLPVGLKAGNYDVYVYTPGVEPVLALQAGFIVQAVAPTISSITPNSLDQTYGTGSMFVVNGANFYKASQVRLKGAQIYELNDESQDSNASQVKATLPQGILPGKYDVEIYSAQDEPIGKLAQAFTMVEVPLHIMAPVVTNTSNPKNSTQLSASWTLPANSPAPQYYQYRVLDNGNEIRGWTDDKIQLATSVTAKGLNLLNGHSYSIQVRGVNASGPGDVATSAATVTYSANLDHDANEKVGLADLQILGLALGKKDKPMADINQNGIVSLDDLGILLSQWNP